MGIRTTAALAAAVAVVAVAAPAHAADTVRQSASAVVLPSTNLHQMNIALACTAVASPGALETRIDGCWLVGDDGRRYDIARPAALPAAAATANALLGVPVQGYRACVQASARFADGGSVRNAPSCG